MGTKIISGILLIIVVFAGSVLSQGLPSPAMQAFEMRMDGQIEPARLFLNEHLAKNPKDAQAYFELSRLSFYTHYERNAKDFDDTQKIIDKAVKYDKKNARYHYWSGIVAGYSGIAKVHDKLSLLVLPGHMRKSMNGFKKALKLDPGMDDARFKLAGLYDRLPWYMGGSKSRAIKETETLEKTSPAYGARSRCQLKPEKSDTEKMDIWEKVLAENPDDAKVLAGIAWQYMHGKDNKAIDIIKAVEYMHKAIAIDKSHISLMSELAMQYIHNENYAMAEKTYTYFIKSRYPYPIALRAYAMKQLSHMKMMQDKEQDAETILIHAKILDPTRWPSKRLPPEDIFIAP